jgi:hypothetical protein
MWKSEGETPQSSEDNDRKGDPSPVLPSLEVLSTLANELHRRQRVKLLRLRRP